MTKTEKAILERIRASNDAGEGANDYRFIGRTQGARYGRFGQRDSGNPKKNEVAALARLVDRGDVEKRQGRFYVAGHASLASTASCLLSRARIVEQRRVELEAAERAYAEELAFLQRWWGQ